MAHEPVALVIAGTTLSMACARDAHGRMHAEDFLETAASEAHLGGLMHMAKKETWGPSMRRIHRRLTATAAGRLAFEQSRVVVEATENLARAMDATGVSKAELARRMRVKPPVVSTMLGGRRNFTLATLAHAFHVLGYSVHVGVGPPADGPRVVDVLRMRVPKAARRPSAKRQVKNG
jgi:hypothetical protein